MVAEAVDRSNGVCYANSIKCCSWPVFRALYFNCPFFVKKTAFLKGKKNPHSSLSAYIYVSFVNLFTLSCFLFLMTDTVS